MVLAFWDFLFFGFFVSFGGCYFDFIGVVAVVVLCCGFVVLLFCCCCGVVVVVVVVVVWFVVFWGCFWGAGCRLFFVVLFLLL